MALFSQSIPRRMHLLPLVAATYFMVSGGPYGIEEILAAHPTREFDRQYSTDRVDGNFFTAMVYQSLTGKRKDWHPAKN